MDTMNEFFKEFRKTELGKVIGDLLERIIDEGQEHTERKKRLMSDLYIELTKFLERNLGCFTMEDYNKLKKKYQKDIEEVKWTAASGQKDRVSC